MLSNIVFISTVEQSGSATCVHTSPLFGFPSHLSHHRALGEFPALCGRSSLLISFIQSAKSVYMATPISQFTPLPFSPWYLYSCSLPPYLYFCFVNKIIYTSLFRFHVCASIYNICFSSIYNICFSLSDLLHSVWQSLGPSTSPQMTQFHSFLWLSNIPLYICTTSSLPIPLLMNIWVFSHVLATVNSAAIKIEVHVSFWFMVFSGFMLSIIILLSFLRISIEKFTYNITSRGKKMYVAEKLKETHIRMLRVAIFDGFTHGWLFSSIFPKFI